MFLTNRVMFSLYSYIFSLFLLIFFWPNDILIMPRKQKQTNRRHTHIQPSHALLEALFNHQRTSFSGRTVSSQRVGNSAIFLYLNEHSNQTMSMASQISHWNADRIEGLMSMCCSRQQRLGTALHAIMIPESI